jgi:hypothetical protein
MIRRPTEGVRGGGSHALLTRITLGGSADSPTWEGDAGRTTPFVMGGEGVYTTMSYNDFFTMIQSPHERERIMDQGTGQAYA